MVALVTVQCFLLLTLVHSLALLFCTHHRAVQPRCRAPPSRYREECGYKWIFIGCGDHSNDANYHNNTADPDDIDTDCSPNHIALFLMVVEEGATARLVHWLARLL